MQKIGRYPIEVFGCVYNDKSKIATELRERQYCKFIDRECTKPRKSEPEIKVGICTVGYKGSFLDHYEPVIICPNRFLEDVVFETIKKRFFPNWGECKWVKEVNMGVSGNVDYVALRMDSEDDTPEDFFCVEFQANGTTGSPYSYVKELLSNGDYSGKKYTFGLNWANEFLKTMMQQVYKKGQVVEHWGRSIAFVIQDVALEYIRSAVDTSDLRQRIDDPVHFQTFKLEWNQMENSYCLKEGEWVSTDLQGINKILAGANSDMYLSEQEFQYNAERKGREDGVI
ncbi:MAG: NotI family restriction endonuclease [Bacillota bacterium]